MTKGKKSKKKSLKLRRQIRKTAGALFMASAIVVAAIPVQDIRATATDDAIAVADAAADTDSRNNVVYNAGGDLVLDKDDMLKPPKNGIYTSYSVSKLSGGSWSLNWQFKYYVVKDDGGEHAIISKYNDTYQQKEVVLSNKANAEYYIVTAQEYSDFYSTGIGAKEYSISYNDYKTNHNNLVGISGYSIAKKYEIGNFTAFIDACEKLYQFEIDGGTGNRPNDPGILKFSPKNDFSEEQKAEYYCDEDKNLKGSGYKLVAVTDNTGTARYSSGLYSEINAKPNSAIAVPEATSTATPSVTPLLFPEAISSAIPEATNEAAASSTPEATSAMTPSVTPEATNITTPSSTPETANVITPSSTPEAVNVTTPSAETETTNISTPDAAALATSEPVQGNETAADRTSLTVANTVKKQGSSPVKKFDHIAEKALKTGNSSEIKSDVEDIETEIMQISAVTTATPDGLSKIVYLPQGGTPSDGTQNDENDFKIQGASKEIFGVANEAFAEVQNIDTLKLPQEIKYIGDKAFYKSFIQEIVLLNVKNIGNHAFQDSTRLKKLTIGNSTVKIGTECFKNTGITSLVLPDTVTEIGGGAFAECGDLQTVDLSKISSSCKIGAYAFFDNVKLTDVNMELSKINSIGEGAFALNISSFGDVWKDVKLPNGITGASDSQLGNFLFANRMNLNSVKFPANYGSSSAIVNVPSGMFVNCINLGNVDFNMGVNSTGCGKVGFDVSGTTPAVTYNKLFIDVINPNFYVSGPENNNSGERSYPRQSTWAAETKVTKYVPYVFINADGKKCYEVSDGTYLIQANDNKELVSCELISKTTKDINLVIPSKVGEYEIETIAKGCFDNPDLRKVLRSITIEDDSLIRIDDEAFKGINSRLEWVKIGNSVKSVGARAFEGCDKLTDITFNTPSGGYEGFTVGEDAFKTGGDELTIHGDIVPGYAPFEFSMGEQSGKIDEFGKRICYKSLSPDYLTVMYDNSTGDVTLLDYPKYSELDDRHKDYRKAMEEHYTKKYGGKDNEYNKNGREMFQEAWDKAGTKDEQEEVYNGPYYGPWIDTTYIGTMASKEKPVPYYTKNPYSITDHYELGNAARGEWEAVTDQELQWINSTLNVVVPAGVTSIDATKFFTSTENVNNRSTYFDSSDEGYDSYLKCTDKTDGIVPGLFSGNYQDYAADPPNEYEKEVKGNDRILSVVLTDVTYLPDYAFDSCERLQNVTLGDDCANIGKAPFRGCDSIADIVGNEHYDIDNRIIYSVNADGSYTIEECLPSRGQGGSHSIIVTDTDPNLAKVSAIVEGAFEDCDYITRVYLDDAVQLKAVPKNCFRNCENLVSVSLPRSVNRIESQAFGGDERLEVTIPGKEVHIVTDAFEHVATNTIWTYEGTSAEDYGNYHEIPVRYLSNLYTVEFFDHDGTKLGETQYIEEGQNAVAPPAPVHEGYTFKEWKPADFTNVTGNMVIIAQCSDNSAAENMHTVTFYAYDGTTEIGKQQVPHSGAAMAPAAPERSGYKFVAWVPGTYTNVTADLSVVATYEKDDSSSGKGTASPSVSPTPTASPSSDASSKKYTVSVSGGSGSGEYAAGAIVSINAYALGTGQVFDKWTTSTAGVGFADATSTSTTFTMPAANVAITATYKTGNGTDTAAGGNGTNGTNGTNGNGTNTAGNGSASTGTTVEVTKPGISNTGLAGATVTGATDNFVVKITEDEAATQAAIAALQAKYGDISRIKYLPMDISLYDSTGRTKIADTTGISVNITLPLPDDLAEYAGNNKMASAAGNTLDDLNTMFTTVDGVPCINFTATHFSPYVVYVDTANLTEATIDATPKTGDPIHPKWFLATGLACVALILFFKRDRAVIPAKTA